jgi:hypothetical protein
MVEVKAFATRLGRSWSDLAQIDTVLRNGVNRIGGPLKIGMLTTKDFFNSIGHERKCR